MRSKFTPPIEARFIAEYHYAPMPGSLAVLIDSVFVRVDGWEERHELMGRFLRMRESGEIKRVRTGTYGHIFFHGHRGDVDVYA